MVLDGAQNSGVRSARRHAGFETLPFSDKPVVRASGDYYPPDGIPAPTTVSIVGDARPEIVAPINDGFVYAIGPDGQRLWRYDFGKGVPKVFASEVVASDLNKDGTPELVTGKRWYAHGKTDPGALDPAVLMYFTLRRDGDGVSWEKHVIDEDSGIGVTFTIADVNADGRLDIAVANKKGIFYFEQSPATP